MAQTLLPIDCFGQGLDVAVLNFDLDFNMVEVADHLQRFLAGAAGCLQNDVEGERDRGLIRECCSSAEDYEGAAGGGGRGKYVVEVEFAGDNVYRQHAAEIVKRCVIYHPMSTLQFMATLWLLREEPNIQAIFIRARSLHSCDVKEIVESSLDPNMGKKVYIC